MRGCAAVLEAQQRLRDSFGRKGEEFAGIIKVGRTQLQDAVPIFLGQEFDAFAETIDEDIIQLRKAMELMREMNLGGTAIGTGLNAPEGFSVGACRHLSAISRLEMVLARNLVEATSDTERLCPFRAR